MSIQLKILDSRIGGQMKHSNICALRISLYDCGGRPPRDYFRSIDLSGAVNISWIPQTIADQIWFVLEFKTNNDRQKFEDNLPPEVSRWIDRGLIEKALKYGWNIRGANGFIEL